MIAIVFARVSQKTDTSFWFISQISVDQFSQSFHCYIFDETVYVIVIKNVHIAINVLLHYLLKLEKKTYTYVNSIHC